MNLQPVTGTQITVTCLGCGKKLVTDRSVPLFAGKVSANVYADLDGPPFKAYYCAECAYKLEQGWMKPKTKVE